MINRGGSDTRLCANKPFLEKSFQMLQGHIGFCNYTLKRLGILPVENTTVARLQFLKLVQLCGKAERTKGARRPKQAMSILRDYIRLRKSLG